ncbi:MAG: peptidoglycan-binding protein [Christensenellaceae bacterium]|jgi:cell wall-associated NlpC family hydrolase|nr:peptidoglycan-binding protein [Christensenellaceae bacterium]
MRTNTPAARAAQKDIPTQPQPAAVPRASFLRRFQLPVLCVLGIAGCAFIGIPLLFNVAAPPPPFTPAYQPVLAEAPTPTPIAVAQVAAPAAPAVQSGTARTLADAYAPLQQGDTSDIVSDLQIRLMELEYLEGDEPSDHFGASMEESVKRFQRVHHMVETGVADALTQELLFSDTALPYKLEQGDAGNDVARLQNQLGDLGYYAEKTNGYFGAATQSALSAFQTKNKLTATGVADQATRNVLYSSAARPKVDPTPTPSPTPKPTPKPTATPKATAKPTATPKASSTQKPSAAATPDGNAFFLPEPEPTASGGSWSGSDSGGIAVQGSGVEAMIATAQSVEGCPYVLADEGPSSFDCSGLLYFSLRSAGVKIGRMSARNFARVSSWQTIESRSSLQRGDLLFFTNYTSASDIGHAAIYLGGNKYIHASSSAGRVIISSWSQWSEDNFRWAKRVF